MKLSFLFACVALCLTSSAIASDFKCAEKASAAIEKNRLQYAVFVKTIAPIKDPRVVGDHDSAELVRVTVLSRDPNEAGRFQRRGESFEAVAKSVDVMYNVNAWKTHGFEMVIYLDELNQNWVKLKGVRGDIRMNCGSNE